MRENYDSQKIKYWGTCFICRDRASIKISYDEGTLYLCERCDVNFFNDLFDYAKIERLREALIIAQTEKVSLGLALNVVRGRYDVKEAKRKQKLKERERLGKSVDMFVSMVRRSGSFH